MEIIYVDNNATTQVDEAVLAAMLPYLKENYGNPSSMHSFGGAIASHIEQARKSVALLIGAQTASEIIFTSCGTESANTAIHSAIECFPHKRHIITSKVEHPCVKNVFDYYEGKGYRVSRIGVDRKGRFNIDQLKDEINDDTAVVSIMYANNETGVIFPIEDIGKIVKKGNALFHCDAVQAVGKIPIDMKKSSIDMLSLSGHKLHAAKGVGVLYVRQGVPYRPFMLGGHQEYGRRGGTENVASIVGLGKACELARTCMEDENTRVKKLRDKLEKGIIERVPNTLVNGDIDNRLPNTTNISFEYIEGESILLLLNELGICASSGSACTSGSLEPSHVLRAMGVPYTAAHGSVRFSLSIYNNEKQIDYMLSTIPQQIEKLRAISPFSKEK